MTDPIEAGTKPMITQSPAAAPPGGLLGKADP